MLADTLKPPYYAVIFTSEKSDNTEGYSEMVHKIRELAEQETGFLGMESVAENFEITVSYWKDLDSIKSWKLNSEHAEAQQKGRTNWYKWYKVRISKVERDYQFNGLVQK